MRLHVPIFPAYSDTHFAGTWRNWLAHRTVDPEVAGSNPVVLAILYPEIRQPGDFQGFLFKHQRLYLLLHRVRFELVAEREEFPRQEHTLTFEWISFRQDFTGLGRMEDEALTKKNIWMGLRQQVTPQILFNPVEEDRRRSRFPPTKSAPRHPPRPDTSHSNINIQGETLARNCPCYASPERNPRGEASPESNTQRLALEGNIDGRHISGIYSGVPGCC